MKASLVSVTLLFISVVQQTCYQSESVAAVPGSAARPSSRGMGHHRRTLQPAQLHQGQIASQIPDSIPVVSKPRYGLRIYLVFVGNRSFPSSVLQAAVAHWAGPQPSELGIEKAVNMFYAENLRDEAIVDRIAYRPAQNQATIWIEEGDPLTFGETTFVTSEQAIVTLTDQIQSAPGDPRFPTRFYRIAEVYRRAGGAANLRRAEAQFQDFIIFYPEHPLTKRARINKVWIQLAFLADAERAGRTRHRARPNRRALSDFLEHYPGDELSGIVKLLLEDF